MVDPNLPIIVGRISVSTTYLIKPFDPWRNPWCTCRPKYTFNPITGCGHGCRYCYITSYIRDPFNPRFKKNILDRLGRDLSRIGRGKVIAVSYSSDPYSPPEDRVRLMPAILRILKSYNVHLLLATKSSLIVRDIRYMTDMDIAVSITVTTLDDGLASIIEPYAPKPMDRIYAAEKLIENGIPVSIRIDPIIPFLNDDEYGIRMVAEAAASIGVTHIVSSIYKFKWDSFRRLSDAYPEYGDKWFKIYVEDGFKHSGYRYAPDLYRFNILRRVRNIVKSIDEGIKFNTCREGFKGIDDPSSYCDGRHLLRTPGV